MMDPSKLPPLRSGLGAVGSQAPNNAQDDTLLRRMVATVAVITQRAGNLAFKTCDHDGREEVTPDDVNAALKHQARHFLSTANEDDVLQEINAMEHVIFETESTGSNDSGSEMDTDVSDDEVSSPTPGIAVPGPKNVVDGICICQECVEVREAVATWDDWDPDDVAEKYLQNSVNNAIAAAAARVPIPDDF